MSKASLPRLLSITAVILCNLAGIASPESFNTEFHEKLGVAYEFKIHVEAGREDCFFQYVQAHASLYVAFQVMRGGDQKAGFVVRDPLGGFTLPYQWSESADVDETAVQSEGYYQFCIDNTHSRFASKLVSLYVASFKRDEWENFIGELSGLEVTVGNVTSSLTKIDHNIGSMIKALDHSRRHNTLDMYLLEANNYYVTFWSMVNCAVIMASSVIQVYFVKKLFLDDMDTKGRPRA